MYLKMNCPGCGQQAEYVHVQVGHSHCCKKCNREFNLIPFKHNFLQYGVVIGVIAGALALAAFLGMRFHDWWIYQK